MEKVVLDKMAEIRKSAGQSDEKIKNSAMEFTTIPEEGTFTHVGTKEFDIPNVGKRISVGLYLSNGGFVSENALNAQELLDTLIQVKNGKRKGRFMLKSARMSDLSKFGASADIRLVELQGKSFTTIPKEDARVYKSEYLDPKEFDKVCFEKDNKESLKKALDCTETKKLYIFKF